jgi:hypothetical protein
VLPKLALIANMAAGYSGRGANLTAGGQALGSCVISPAPMIGAAANVTAPGAGACGTSVLPGTYSLFQTALTTPSDLPPVVWDCYDISSGNSRGFAGFDPDVTPETVTLGLGDVVTCVADYTP